MITNFLSGVKQLSDNDGAPLNGGLVYFYQPGTSTPKDTYTTSGVSVANANPVVLDSAGRANIWLDGNYKVIVKDSDGVTIYTEDNINPDPAAFLGQISQGWLAPAQNLAASRITVSSVTVSADKIAVTKPADDSTVVLENVSIAAIDLSASGANGLDTGAEQISTWYYYHVIYNEDTEAVAGLFSLSSSAPVLPTGYTHFALCGAARNNSAGDLRTFSQVGDRFAVSVQTSLANGTSATYAAVDLSDDCPPIANTIYGGLGLARTSGSSSMNATVSPAGTTPGEINIQEPGDSTSTSALKVPFDSIMTTPQTLYYKVGANCSLDMYLHGFSI